MDRVALFVPEALERGFGRQILIVIKKVAKFLSLPQHDLFEPVCHRIRSSEILLALVMVVGMSKHFPVYLVQPSFRIMTRRTGCHLLNSRVVGHAIAYLVYTAVVSIRLLFH